MLATIIIYVYERNSTNLIYSSHGFNKSVSIVFLDAILEVILSLCSIELENNKSLS